MSREVTVEVSLRAPRGPAGVLAAIGAMTRECGGIDLRDIEFAADRLAMLAASVAEERDGYAGSYRRSGAHRTEDGSDYLVTTTVARAQEAIDADA